MFSRKLFLFASILSLCLVMVAGTISAQQDGQPNEKLVELTDDTIDAALRQNPLVFIIFYAPWCGHSKKMMPDFMKIANSGDYPNILFGRVDASVNVAATKKFDIKHFPTLRFFRHGNSFGDYEGSRDAEAITTYLKHVSRHGVKVFPNKDRFTALLDQAQFSTAICCDEANSETCKPFEKASDKARNIYIRWFSFASAAQVEEFGLGKYLGKVIVVKGIGLELEGTASTDEGRFQVAKNSGANANYEDLLHEIHLLSVATFGALNPDTYRDYMHIKLPMLYLFLSSDVKELNEVNKKAYEAVKSVANSYRGKLTFVHIDASKYGSLAPRVGLNGDHFPALAIDASGSFYNIGQDPKTVIDASRVRHFADDYLSGKLVRHIRSENIPAKHTDDNGLTTVVAHNFDQVVLKSENDVFIQFYAPWCSHCKEMNPALNDLAKKMKDEEITIARFDATSNEYNKDKFNVLGFPTMYYIKKNSNNNNEENSQQQQGPYSIEEYTGGRTLEEMLTYVREKVDQ